METKVDIYYHLYIGDKFIQESFATRQDALDFGRQHKKICEDCRGKPMKIEGVRVMVETVVSYHEDEGA